MTESFIENLAAGLIIFILDVILIVIALPYILHLKETKKWRPTRAALHERLAAELHSTNLELKYLFAHDLDSSHTSEDVLRRLSQLNHSESVAFQETVKLSASFAPAFNAEISGAFVEYLSATSTQIGAVDLLIAAVNENSRGAWRPAVKLLHDSHAKRRDGISKLSKYSQTTNALTLATDVDAKTAIERISQWYSRRFDVAQTR